MRRRLLVAAIGLALVAALAAPVTAGATTAGAVHAMSKKEFIKAADDLCRQSDILLDAAAAENFAGVGEDEQPSPEQLDAYVTDVEPVLRQLVDSLRALPKPKKDKKKLKKIFNLVEDAVDTVVDDPTVFLTDEDPFAKADRAAHKYGFKVCGTD
jgi:hypothetical protein